MKEITTKKAGNQNNREIFKTKMRGWKLHPFVFINTILSIIMLIFNSNAYAFDFIVNPIRLHISSNKITTTFEIENRSNELITLETEVKKWDQDEEGNDILIPTEKLVVVPPYIELEPKQKQIVRLAYLGDFSKPLETYRLIVRKLPRHKKPERNITNPKAAIQFIINMSFPVFVTSTDKDLSYKVTILDKKFEDNVISLKIENSGPNFVKILKIKIYNNEEELIEKKYIKYILPEKKLNLKLDLKKYTNTNNLKKPNKIILITEDGNEIKIDI